MSADEKDIAGVIAPPSLIYGGSLAIGFVLHRLIPLRLMAGGARSRRTSLGLGLIVAGAIPTLWAVATMFRHGNNPEPSHPVVSLVVDGPYRFSRNPIYLSLTAVYLGAGILLGTFWHLLLLPAVLTVMRRGVVEREEAYLTRRFGADYQAYMSSVRRWL